MKKCLKQKNHNFFKISLLLQFFTERMQDQQRNAIPLLVRTERATTVDVARIVVLAKMGDGGRCCENQHYYNYSVYVNYFLKNDSFIVLYINYKYKELDIVI